MNFTNNVLEQGKSHHLNFIEFNNAYKKELQYEEFQKTLRQLKRGVWVYFFLLIFEGALRKWVFPGLSDLLLLVREPIALWLVIKAVRHKLLPSNIYLNIIVSIAFIGLFTALFFGHGNLAVALFGARIFLVQFPVLFVIGAVFDRQDVIKLGKVLIWISIPMVILTAIQFYSPQSAWVNRGIGGDIKGAGFEGALGFFRPPGTFSFTSGNVSFFSFVSSFILYFWLDRKNINHIILITATIGLIAAIPLSISRGLFLGVSISVIFAAVAMLRKPRFIGRAIFIGMIVFGGLLILNTSGFFKTSKEAFAQRYETANEAEGGGLSETLVNRIFGTKKIAVFHSPAIPFFGYGLGMGTNVGAKLLTGGRTFLIAEEEWGRLIGELGPTLGFLVIMTRLALFTKMARSSYRKLMVGDLLPWMLLSFCLLNLPIEQWSQPASLGFTILIGGVILASLKKN